MVEGDIVSTREGGLKHPVVRLVQFAPGDAGEIFELIDCSRQHLSQYGDRTAKEYLTVDSVLRSILKPPNPDKLRYAVRDEMGTLIGSINLTPDEKNTRMVKIGYYLGKGFIGRGYMGEAVRLLTEHAFNKLGFEVLFGKVHKDNLASIRVLEGVGYVKFGREGKEIIFTRRK